MDANKQPCEPKDPLPIFCNEIPLLPKLIATTAESLPTVLKEGPLRLQCYLAHLQTNTFEEAGLG